MRTLARPNLCIPGCVLLVMCLLSQIRAADDFREWTDATGRKVEAAYGGMEGAQVKLRMRTGALIPFPLEKLSAQDQAWVKQQQPAALSPGLDKTGLGMERPGTAGDKPGGSEKVWPRTVALEELPVPTVVKEDPAAKEFIYRTTHFEFRSDSRLGADVVREFARMFEATLELNKALPLQLDPKPELGHEFFVAKLYTIKADYLADGGMKGSAGMYFSRDRMIKVPLDSLGVKMAGKHFIVEPQANNSTLIHEITHQMMNHWLNRLPQWYVEGSAEYAASVKYQHGRFTLSQMGEANKKYLVWKHGISNGHFTMWHVDYLMNITQAAWMAAFGDHPDENGGRNYGSAQLLTYYFYHVDDKGSAANIIAYLKDIAAGKPEKQASADHLLRGRDPRQIEKELAAALRKDGLTVDFVGEAPSAATTQN